jgi:mRNA interferase MazF
MPSQGEIWWAELDKRRPVLIVSRSETVAVLQRLVVAPVTRTVRGIPTEIPLGVQEGLPVDCVASFDNLQVVLRRTLTDHAGQLRDGGRHMICAALAALADC